MSYSHARYGNIYQFTSDSSLKQRTCASCQTRFQPMDLFSRLCEFCRVPTMSNRLARPVERSATYAA